MPALAIGIGSGLAAAAGIGVAAHAIFSPRGTLFGPLVCRGAPRPGAAPAVALTFDDGPWPGATDAVLDILRAHAVPAAFFVIGRYASNHPDFLRRAHAEDHIIGNHSFDHSRRGIFRLGRYWDDQVRRTGDAVHSAIGLRPALFRPPMGFKSPHVMGAARRAACRVVTWSRRAFDGVARSPGDIVRHALRAEPGDVILLHDGRDPASRRELGATAAALPQIIDGLRARGLAIDRLDRLTDLAPYQETPAPA